MSTPSPPRRGTAAYRHEILRVADAPTLEDATTDLSRLWDTYGWRSVIDVMTEWVVSIDFILPRRYRDLTGTVDITRWALPRLVSQERMLEHAVHRAETDARQAGVPVHEAFSDAHATTDRLVKSIGDWQPVYRNALAAAHIHHDRKPIAAALSRGPGVRPRDWWPLRDGAAYLYQVASWPIQAARRAERPVRPLDYEWIARDTTLLPDMILADLHEGEHDVRS